MNKSLTRPRVQLRCCIRLIQLYKELQDADQQVLVSEYELEHLPRFPRPKPQVLETKEKEAAEDRIMKFCSGSGTCWSAPDGPRFIQSSIPAGMFFPKQSLMIWMPSSLSVGKLKI